MSVLEPSGTQAAVVGAGVMGAGIAHVLAAAGASVVLFDPDPAALQGALARIEAMAGALGQEIAPVKARLSTTTELAEAAADARIVIEAGPEQLSVKREIFAALLDLAPDRAVLASNTSAIPIRDIAAGVSGSERILGTHFWHPPQLVPLVEVIQSDATSPEAVDWTIALLAVSGMRPVRIRADVPGFVGNRLQHALKREAIALVAAGVCDAETLDTVVTSGFGIRLGILGPLEQADLGGLDLTYKIHQVVMPALDNTPVPHPYLAAKVERGELGAKTGRGFGEWTPERARARRQEVEHFLLDAARRRQAQATSGPDEEE